MQSQDRPRKRPSRAMRETIYQRSDGVCQRDGCERPIELDTFHVAHLRAHAHGGALVESNLEAWCSRCNLTWGVDDVRDTRVEPRDWQLDALDTIVKRITDDGVATLTAAPGAGKTIFTGLVFETLHDAGVVDRMVVLAPRRTLVDQWAGALYGACHIELKPSDQLERPGQDGVVTTYQSLNADTLNVHRTAAAHQRTLLVLDEVHHVGEKPPHQTRPAWARNVAELAGDVETGLNVAGVLNLSGTLWRSRRDERISTVRYHALEDGRLEAEEDWKVPAEDLIRAGELRPIDIRHVDGRVEVFDTAQFEMIDSNMADLDEAPARATLRELGAHQPWRQAFVRSILDRLQEAHEALGGHHVKALIVAARQKDARLFQNEVNEQMRARGLRPLAEIAVSDDPDAARTLEAFRRSDRVGVLCTVDMAGEGYDCSDIAVIGYATNKLTNLYVRQVVARAQRVTKIEHKRGQVIPAIVVVPDVPVLVDQLKQYLAPISHEITVGDEEPWNYDRESNEVGEARLVDLAYHVQSITPGAEHVTVPLSDGDVTFTAEQLHAVASHLERYNLPTVLHARVLAAMGDIAADAERRRPFDASAVATHDAVTRPVSIEEASQLTMGQIRELEKWWAVNGDCLPGVFAGRANAAGGIQVRGGRDSATPDQLKLVLEHEVVEIAAYCQRTGKTHPRGMRGV